MKSTKLFTTIAASAALLASTGFATTAFAADVNSQATSNATVTLTGASDTETHEPTNPGDGTVTHNAGPLTLDYVPNFKFGTHAVNADLTNLVATDTTSFAQVTDARGTGAGWKLQLALGEFTDGANKLNGTTLTLTGSTKSVVANTSTAPAVSSVTLAPNGQPADLVVAGADAGMGQWLVDFFNESGSTASLSIPQGNKAGNYSAEILWRLTDAV